MTTGRLLLVLPLFLVLASGCTRNPGAPASLSGKVTYKGTAVTGGTVTVHTKDGAGYSIPIKPDGTYSGTDLPAGDMVLTVETESVNKDKKTPVYGGRAGGQSMSPVPEGVKAGGGGYVKIPAKYADKAKSGLTVTLSKGKQTKDLELTD
jgi:hypothetical protein